MSKHPECAIIHDDDVGPGFTLRRSDPPEPKHFARGDKYFEHTWEDGAGQYVPMPAFAFGMGRVRNALEIHVIDVLADGTVIEEARTWNRPSLKREGFTHSIPPRSRGWSIHDALDDKYTVWRRARTWDMIA